MSDYRRYFVPGGTYFFTVVTEGRRPLFRSELAQRLLGVAIRECARRFSFETVAMVLLPEHLHAVWSLPPGDDRFSLRWSWIKREFTRAWLAGGGTERVQPRSRLRERRRGVWQRRFWEHLIRDEADLEAHFDYVHFNPVKHGLVTHPGDWSCSTFHRWVKAGHYSRDWAAGTLLDLPGNAGE